MKQSAIKFILALTILLILYVALSPASILAGGAWNFLVFRPWQFCRDYSVVRQICGVKPQNIFFPSKNGNILHGWYFDAHQGKIPAKELIVLVSHGNSGNIAGRTSIAQAILSSGTSVFLYDYQGFGKSQGHPSLQCIVEDGTSAFDYITKQLGFKDNQVVLYGESLGTGVSCEVANKRNCSGLVLQSGFIGLPELAKEKVWPLMAYPNMMFPLPQLHNSELVKHINCPVLVFHGTNDTLIPVKHAEVVYANAAHKYKLVEIVGARHSNLYGVNPIEMTDTLSAFLDSIYCKSDYSNSDTIQRG